MNDFIQMAVKQLGIDQKTAQTATGGVLDLVRQHAGEADFGKLAGMVPGAKDMLGMAPSGGAGGALGGLLGAASKMIGGKAGAAIGAMGFIEKSGLKADQAGPFVGMLVKYIQGKGAGDVLSAVMSKVPELKKLVG